MSIETRNHEITVATQQVGGMSLVHESLTLLTTLLIVLPIHVANMQPVHQLG